MRSGWRSWGNHSALAPWRGGTPPSSSCPVWWWCSLLCRTDTWPVLSWHEMDGGTGSPGTGLCVGASCRRWHPSYHRLSSGAGCQERGGFLLSLLPRWTWWRVAHCHTRCSRCRPRTSSIAGVWKVQTWVPVPQRTPCTGSPQLQRQGNPLLHLPVAHRTLFIPQINPTQNHKVTTYNSDVHRYNTFTHHSTPPSVYERDTSISKSVRKVNGSARASWPCRWSVWRRGARQCRLCTLKEGRLQTIIWYSLLSPIDSHRILRLMTGKGPVYGA